MKFNDLCKILTEADFTLGPKDQGRDFGKLEQLHIKRQKKLNEYQAVAREFYDAADKLKAFLKSKEYRETWDNLGFEAIENYELAFWPYGSWNELLEDLKESRWSQEREQEGYE